MLSCLIILYKKISNYENKILSYTHNKRTPPEDTISYYLDKNRDKIPFYTSTPTKQEIYSMRRLG
jgi:hypothetical protein